MPCVLEHEKVLGVLFRFDVLSASLLAIVPGVRPALLGYYLLKWLSPLLLSLGATLRGGSLHPVLLTLQSQ